MSGPDRNNPYSFEDFLQWRDSVDFYGDDDFSRRVIRHFTGDLWPEVDAAARSISPKVSGRWRLMADEISRPEKRPFMMHYDGHKNRIDRIVRPHEIEVMEKEVFGEALFSSRTHPWVRLVKMFLIYQLSEACLACPITCTEGLAAILELLADSPEAKAVLKHLKEGHDNDFAIGAQFLSEIQGGSDVPANLVEASQEDGVWRLYGNKFFCSAAHADYAAVTAKPADSDKVALFVMPMWDPAQPKGTRRNNFTIDRLKWKMGTSELPTAEITLYGSIAYQVGPLDRGVANVVGVVLTYSRLTVGLSGAAGMVRAAREARKYAEFRTAFGLPVASFPMAAAQLDRIDRYARRTTAGAFKLYSRVLDLPGGLTGGAADESEADRRRRFQVRELIMLQKIASAWDSPEVIRLAMSIYGGHGVMEDFTTLPRFYRDAAVNELWEGPRNVLLTQIHRDMARASSWYRPSEIVADILEGADQETVLIMAAEADKLVGHGDLFQPDEKTREVCLRWDDFCHRLYHEYQELAVREVETGLAGVDLAAGAASAARPL